MKRILIATLTSMLVIATIASTTFSTTSAAAAAAAAVLVTHAQNGADTAGTSKMNPATKPRARRGPVFRASKEQIRQAQTVLRQRGFYGGEASGRLDEVTRAGLRKYQTAESIEVTGTLNRATLEKMKIALTEKQQAR